MIRNVPRIAIPTVALAAVALWLGATWLGGQPASTERPTAKSAAEKASETSVAPPELQSSAVHSSVSPDELAEISRLLPSQLLLRDPVGDTFTSPFDQSTTTSYEWLGRVYQIDTTVTLSIIDGAPDSALDADATSAIIAQNFDGGFETQGDALVLDSTNKATGQPHRITIRPHGLDSVVQVIIVGSTRARATEIDRMVAATLGLDS